jgi:DNA polymerase-4
VPRDRPSIAHIDLDAFFAAVEQRDKPSLRGKPVVVGGIGPRGVVSTASYEARRFGVTSAMATAQARSRCPYAAYLYPRFGAYRTASRQVMAVLADFSDLIEPLSLDEAFLDLDAGPLRVSSTEEAQAWAATVRARIMAATGGLTASAGVATSKMVAKIASDLDKPDGLVVVPPGTEADLLAPMGVRVIPGIGPATAERLRRAGATTVGQVRELSDRELVSLLGQAHGSLVARFSRAEDDREVRPDRPAKSVSVEDTYDTDVTDPAVLAHRITDLAGRVCGRLAATGLSGRTVTIKVRLYDFTTTNRSTTLAGPTDDARVVAPCAVRLLRELDCSAGVRLLGVGVSGLSDWVQDELFTDDGLVMEHGTPAEPSGDPQPGEPAAGPIENELEDAVVVAGAIVGEDVVEEEAHRGPADRTFADRFPGPADPGWRPGEDVEHDRHGRGWVWGSGRGKVTVRFETAETDPGPVHTFASDDERLHRYEPWDPD